MLRYSDPEGGGGGGGHEILGAPERWVTRFYNEE